MKAFFEQMFFHPRWYHYPVVVLLLPVSWLYGMAMWVRRKMAQQINFGIPVLSVGNLIVGGTGKTPFVIALASRYDNVAIISRGYRRQSTGLIEVSHRGVILADVTQSGDEPMLMATSLPKASVIVCEDRHEAIRFAKRKGAKCIVLDDGFNQVNIEKLDILLEPLKIQNYYTFPSGPFREFVSTRRCADIIAKEGKAFYRKVDMENMSDRMVLITAISNPKRLNKYLPEGIVKKVYYDDHAYFDEVVLQKILEEHDATSILCTSKDKVKMKDFKLPISEMKLKLEIKKEILAQIDTYVKQYKINS